MNAIHYVHPYSVNFCSAYLLVLTLSFNFVFHMQLIATYLRILSTAFFFFGYTTSKVYITVIFVTLVLQIRFRTQYMGALRVNLRVEFCIINSGGSSVVAVKRRNLVR